MRLKNLFERGGAARDVAVLTFGTMLSQAIIIFATPMLSRLYAPADFGGLAVFIAMSTVVATVVTMRYETAILVVKRDDDANTLVGLALILAFCGAALLAGGSCIISHSKLQLLVGAQVSSLFPLVFFVGGVTAFISVMQTWLNRHKRYNDIAKLRVFQSLMVVCLALMFGYVSLNLSGLLWAHALAFSLTAFGSVWCTRSALKLWRPRQVLNVARSEINAPKYLLPTAILDAFTMQMPVLLIGVWFGGEQAGQFSMAWRMLMLPMALLGGGVGQVFMQRLSQAQLGSRAARHLLMKTWLLLLAVGAVPMLMVFIFGKPIFSIFLGEAWGDAGLMAAALSPLALAMFLSSPTSGSFIVLGIQRYSLWFGIAVFIYRPICIFLGHIYENVVLGLVLWAICEIVQVALYQLIAWKKMGQLDENVFREKNS